MATPQPSVQGQVDESGQRLVWVLNRDGKPYKGTFEGQPIVIPENLQKIGKLYYEGGNLMPYLAARQFITDYKEPQEWVMDKSGKPQPVFGPKALDSYDLTAEEFNTYVRKTSSQLKKELAAEERRARKNLSKELENRPNKIAAADDEDL